jgi:hypothetical protein
LTPLLVNIIFFNFWGKRDVEREIVGRKFWKKRDVEKKGRRKFWEKSKNKRGKKIFGEIAGEKKMWKENLEK